MRSRDLAIMAGAVVCGALTGLVFGVVAWVFDDPFHLANR